VGGPIFFRRNPIPTQGDPAYDSTALAGRRFKPKGKRRKPYAIETRLKRTSSGYLSRAQGLNNWHTYNRYETKSRRDQAFDALVKKEALSSWQWGCEYRKKDE
jgi:hypothetical protein